MTANVLPPIERALQINMCPTDYRHVLHCLPHQLRSFEAQVDRIHLTIDMGKVTSGRYREDNHGTLAEKLMAFLQQMQAQHPKIVLDIVDYSDAGRALVQEPFFRSAPKPYPAKAFDGGPFHVYFWGMAASRARYILHMDSDMLFGGQSQTWISEAIALGNAQAHALFIAPLGGPPRHDGKIEPQNHHQMPGITDVSDAQLIARDPLTIAYQTVSTRIFLIDMQRFHQVVGSLEIIRPSFKRRMRSLALAQDPSAKPAEELLSHCLMKGPYRRLDFLGAGSGLYSLHPTYRSEDFYANLPNLIARIEAGDIPDAQRGDHDINQSMQDWSQALAGRSRSKRFKKALRHLISANLSRFKA
jgi:hypothetical protein